MDKTPETLADQLNLAISQFEKDNADFLDNEALWFFRVRDDGVIELGCNLRPDQIASLGQKLVEAQTQFELVSMGIEVLKVKDKLKYIKIKH